ncbi:Stp1/IreP family PP2C-type Ser/Thr phosphatase [Sporosarcina sp. Marseille-Q4063]|uniref:Stp1/IreP family PP2C-type Ser/Thr phosphatase n=1 Tax=Sporosarcina sp. Marseille-Q4063 TaxID=2810514 RepID=UPI0020160AA6|nr:Stp1/IreP family PP2C-type Ser/Thr phosphatase [Sporosarcina sp. Marseille-Q4063]
MVQFEVLSDIGKKRTVNEDGAAVFTLPEGITLAVIADGMGGHRGGDFASSTAITVLEEEFMKLKDREIDQEMDWTVWLKETIFQVNRFLFNYAKDHEEYKGMGTTLEAAIIKNHSCHIYHIGDSRVYLIDPEGIRQITVDHSYVNVLLESGEITKEEAAKHPQRNWIMKALGSERTIEPDYHSEVLGKDSYLLLCTDGLSNKVDVESMQSIILSDRSLREKTEALVNLANKLGGEDNISVILLKPSDEEVSVL